MAVSLQDGLRGTQHLVFTIMCLGSKEKSKKEREEGREEDKERRERERVSHERQYELGSKPFGFR